ncbi:MAG: fasciclin domain-containing protein [Calothrix sp. SM1_7_51]|nr:fasciclin domain-containing protein [Calothrix sp. SM1_7_51]
MLVSVPAFGKSCQQKADAVKSSQTIIATEAQAAQAGTIVDVASSNPNFTTLVTAVKAADLVETLSGQGPFTVFAPTNAAFAKVPKAILNKLLKPENKTALQKVLTYHVLSGAVDSKAIKPGKVKTVEGNTVTIAVSKKGGVTVNRAKVIQADVKASNGVIHVIDTVIIPPGLKLK